MSAGGLSYSGLTSYGKATLPSVTGGLGSMNILKDPPKSIHTRRIDKVGENSDITQWIQDSGDRSCEAITQYARGVNPMVSVSYHNNGNNGGQRGGSIVPSMNGSVQARLPYAIGSGGSVFRPPTLRQENLLPLSRLPRVWTKAYTNKEFPDFSRKMVCAQPAERTRQVKNSVIKTSVRPTRTYKLETPISEPFEVKYVIQNPVQVSANSGVRQRDIGKQAYVEPVRGINQAPMHTYAQSQKTSTKHIDNNEKNTDKYIQDTHHSDVSSKAYRKMQTTPISEIMDLNILTKDTIHVSYETPQSRTKQQEYIHEDPDLHRRLPYHKATTNNGFNIQKNIIENPYQLEQLRNIPVTKAYTNVGSLQTHGGNSSQITRDYKLNPTINAGGFHNSGTRPNSRRVADLHDITSPKNDLSKRAVQHFDDRYRHGFVNGHDNQVTVI